MLNSEKAHAMLRRVIFKIRIEPREEDGAWLWGTGFFISRDGYALTAYHNLPAPLQNGDTKKVHIFYKEKRMKLDCRLEMSLPWPEDIAVLKLSNPASRAIEPVPLGYFDPSADTPERNRFWAGRPVCIVGYPFGEFGQMERVVTGAAAALQPCVVEDIKSELGDGREIEGTVQWLQMVGSPAEELEGISGAPVLDLRSGTIAAVEHIYYPGRNIIIGSEIGWLLKRIPDFGRIPDKLIELRHQDGPGADLRTAYLSRLFKDAGGFTLSVVDPKAAGGGQVQLDSVYTALMTVTPKDEERSLKASSRKDELQRLSALEQLNRHQRLVLLGDPGGGKSTFVNFVTICLAGEQLGEKAVNLKMLTAPLPDDKGADRKKPQPWDHKALLPVRVILRDFAVRGLPAVGEPAGADHVLEFIKAGLGVSLRDYAEPLESELRRGALVLFDGLDEVPDPERRREQIKQAVEGFSAAFPNCRLLVTCRTYAYQPEIWRLLGPAKDKQPEDWKLEGFADVVLAPFSEGQIRWFVDRWYAQPFAWRGLQPGEDPADRAEELKKAILAGERLQELAKRPILLTLMAHIHFNERKLPENREQLYNKATMLLLHWWEQQKEVLDGQGGKVNHPGLTTWLKIEHEDLLQLISELTFQLVQRRENPDAVATISVDDIWKGLRQVCDRKGCRDVMPALLEDYLRERNGLLLPLSRELYVFPHRTFEEYLAACHLARCDFPQEVAALARRQPERWREVALLAGARAAREDGERKGKRDDACVWALAEALCFADPGGTGCGKDDIWGAHLAGLLLAETADLTKKLPPQHEFKLKRVQDWLVNILERDLLPAVERVAAGNVLARIGDPRFRGRDEWYLPSDGRLGFVEVPAGPFTMGEGGEEHKVNPPAFWIGRFSVTAAQFRAFVEDSGHWPANKECLMGTGNHPVAYVNWFDALAYCDWLTGKLKEWAGTPEDLAELLQKSKKPTWRIALPSEAEWEKAARGADGRSYPWGNEADSNRANYSATGIGGTSAVGCFAGGKSPYGCLDMAGNVFEWTRSLKEKYPYISGDGRENLRDKNGSRVLRGGAFHSGEHSLRCALRLRYYSPDGALVSRGFRVVLSPFLSGI